MTKDQAARVLSKIAGYLEILRQDPRSTAFVPLSDAYRHMGMLEEALSVARKGVEALPFFSPGYLVLGRAQMQCGDLEGAARSFHQALEHDPTSVTLLKSMAKLCVLQGDKEQACDLLGRAIEQAPEDPVLVNLRNALQPVSQNVASDQESLEEVPGETLFATATVADLYVRQGHPDKALPIYKELLQAQPDDASLRERFEHARALLSGVDSASFQSEECEAEQPSGTSDTSGVVATLQKWLLAIQVRRKYVQEHSAGHC